MKASAVRDRSQIGLIDYALVTVGSSLAAFSAGMAISEPAVSNFTIGLIVVGAVFSWLVRTLLGKTAFVTIDGIVYAGAVVISIVLLGPLNACLPGGGFPREVMLASALLWMLILGSFCTWRDGTLLFQAIPAIALFGLVGCYDTYRGVVYAFFGFLLCLATLFARAHTREMLQQAVESGWFNRADSPGRAIVVTRSMALYERIKEGPWKWLAGPEWALASALAVIGVSLVGAPVIQQSVKDVSGVVKLPTPPIKSSTPPVIGNSSMSDAKIGQGPLANLSDAPLYEAQLDHLRYLRGAAYDMYAGDGWKSSGGNPMGSFGMTFDSSNAAEEAAVNEIRHKETFAWKIRTVAPASLIPIPGDVVRITGQNQPTRQRDESWTFHSFGNNGTVSGESVESDPRIEPKTAVAQLPTELLETTSLADVPESVKKLARESARGAKTDFERANQIMAAIDRHARYNLKAKAVPAGRDPVEFFLFDSHEGYCDLFASSMVLMARSVGIPARYVTGFLPSPNRVTNGTYVVVDADAHAWAELFFQGVGWVVFDATEGAEQVPDAGRGAANAGPPWYQTKIFEGALDGLIALSILGAGFVAFRALKPSRDPSLARRQLGRIYAQYVSLLESKAQVRRQPAATPDEFLDSVVGSLNGSAPQAKELNRRFVRAFYADEPFSAEGLASLRADLRDFKSAVRKDRVERRR